MNCKPGDMAFIKDSRNYRKDVGKIVEIIQYVTHGDFQTPDGRLWDVVDSDCWLIQSKTKSLTTGEWAVWSDSRLIPIRPDESPEESTEAMRLLTQLPQKEKV